MYEFQDQIFTFTSHCFMYYLLSSYKIYVKEKRYKQLKIF